MHGVITCYKKSVYEGARGYEQYKVHVKLEGPITTGPEQLYAMHLFLAFFPFLYFLCALLTCDAFIPFNLFSIFILQEQQV